MKKRNLAVPVVFLLASIANAALFAEMLYGKASALVILNLFVAGCGVGVFGVFTIVRMAERREAE